MPRKFYNLVPLVSTIVLTFIITISCSNNKHWGYLGKKLELPECCTDIDTTAKYTFIHIVRNQSCTQCSVSSLYQWDFIVSMIDRKDFSYLFIVETRDGDTDEAIHEALSRRPFSLPLFIDFEHEFIERNKWLEKKKYKRTNDFLVNPSGRIIATGDPMTDLQYMKYLKNYRSKR